MTERTEESQPGKVWSQETSGSWVGTPPCVVERPGAKRGGTTGRSVASVKLRGLTSVVIYREGAEPLVWRRRPRKVPGIRKRAPKDPPAQWARNGQMVVLGNGEILLGPATTGGGKRCLPITGAPGKWYGGREEVGGGRTSRRRRGRTQPRPMRRAPGSSMHDVRSEGVGQ
jgi:hypothetical protein